MPGIPENIDGYRRTSIKKRDKGEAERRAQEFRDRGDKARVEEYGGYHIVYVKNGKK